jgi:hypothetical protein
MLVRLPTRDWLFGFGRVIRCVMRRLSPDRRCPRRGAVVGNRVQFEFVGLCGARPSHDVDGGHPSTTPAPTSTRAPALPTPAIPAAAPPLTRIEVDSTPEQYFVLYLRPGPERCS